MFLTIQWKIGLMGQVGKWQILCVNKFFKTQKIVAIGRFISLSVNEVTTINN
jgi:hypothetical protein